MKNKRQKQKRVNKEKGNGIATILTIIGVITIFSSIFMTIKVATSGARLTMLEEQKRKLVKENDNYKRELVNSSSLTSLGLKTEELGYVKPESVIYIQEEEPVAKLP